MASRSVRLAAALPHEVVEIFPAGRGSLVAAGPRHELSHIDAVPLLSSGASSFTTHNFGNTEINVAVPVPGRMGMYYCVAAATPDTVRAVQLNRADAHNFFNTPAWFRTPGLAPVRGVYAKGPYVVVRTATQLSGLVVDAGVPRELGTHTITGTAVHAAMVTIDKGGMLFRVLCRDGTYNEYSLTSVGFESLRTTKINHSIPKNPFFIAASSSAADGVAFVENSVITRVDCSDASASWDLSSITSDRAVPLSIASFGAGFVVAYRLTEGTSTSILLALLECNGSFRKLASIPAPKNSSFYLTALTPQSVAVSSGSSVYVVDTTDRTASSRKSAAAGFLDIIVGTSAEAQGGERDCDRIEKGGHAVISAAPSCAEIQAYLSSTPDVVCGSIVLALCRAVQLNHSTAESAADLYDTLACLPEASLVTLLNSRLGAWLQGVRQSEECIRNASLGKVLETLHVALLLCLVGDTASPPLSCLVAALVDALIVGRSLDIKKDASMQARAHRLVCLLRSVSQWAVEVPQFLLGRASAELADRSMATKQPMHIARAPFRIATGASAGIQCESFSLTEPTRL